MNDDRSSEIPYRRLREVAGLMALVTLSIAFGLFIERYAPQGGKWVLIGFAAVTVAVFCTLAIGILRIVTRR
jgi:hypothetical protein